MADHARPVDAARAANLRARGVGDAGARALGRLLGVLAGPRPARTVGALRAAGEGR